MSACQTMIAVLTLLATTDLAVTLVAVGEVSLAPAGNVKVVCFLFFAY